MDLSLGVACGVSTACPATFLACVPTWKVGVAAAPRVAEMIE